MFLLPVSLFEDVAITAADLIGRLVTEGLHEVSGPLFRIDDGRIVGMSHDCLIKSIFIWVDSDFLSVV